MSEHNIYVKKQLCKSWYDDHIFILFYSKNIHSVHSANELEFLERVCTFKLKLKKIKKN